MMERWARHGLLLAMVAMMTMVVGCNTPIDGGDEDEPNNDFDQAQTVAKASDGGEIAGVLDTDDDIDVFDIGQLTEGQIFTVDYRPGNYSLGGCDAEGVTVALFDADNNFAMLSDYLGCDNAMAFTVVIQKTGNYTLAIASVDRLAGQLEYLLAYGIDGTDVYTKQHQVVYLQFDGGTNIDLGEEDLYDAEPLSTVFGADSDDYAAGITEVVREDYDGLDIEIISSRDELEPAGEHTTVYVSGTADPELLGLADSIDWYNANLTNNAIIFVGSYADEIAGWTKQQTIQAIGNVTSHELGHVLGLIHTNDNTEVMDTTTPTGELDIDQDFHRALIDDFPIGWEDCAEMLDIIMGL